MEQNDKLDAIYGALAAQRHLIALLAARVCKLDHMEFASLRRHAEALQSDFLLASDALAPGGHEQNIINAQLAYEKQMSSILVVAEAIASQIPD
jgi:hypothetical protein